MLLWEVLAKFSYYCTRYLSRLWSFKACYCVSSLNSKRFRAYYFVASDFINLFVAQLHFENVFMIFLSPYLVLFTISVLFCHILSFQFLFKMPKFCWPTRSSLTKIIVRYDQNLKCTIFFIKATNLLLVLSTCRKKKIE